MTVWELMVKLMDYRPDDIVKEFTLDVDQVDEYAVDWLIEANPVKGD